MDKSLLFIFLRFFLLFLEVFLLECFLKTKTKDVFSFLDGLERFSLCREF